MNATAQTHVELDFVQELSTFVAQRFTHQLNMMREKADHMALYQSLYQQMQEMQAVNLNTLSIDELKELGVYWYSLHQFLQHHFQHAQANMTQFTY